MFLGNGRRPAKGLLAGALVTALMAAPALVPVQAHPSSQQSALSLALSGGITDAGHHIYTSAGGQLVFATILGQEVEPAQSSFTYKIHANMHGTWVTGDASFLLKGAMLDGTPVSVSAKMNLNKVAPLPAETFPVGCTDACTSEIVAFYQGIAHVDISVGSTEQRVDLPISFESAFLNPFGNPIIIASGDSAMSIFIVTTYSQADIRWLGATSAGSLSGTLDGTPVAGAFTINTMAKDENLLTGTESETGWITFSGMSIPRLDVSGFYQGSSVIPSTNTVDCSFLTGVPGTCTLTGFTSQGNLWLWGHKLSITGSYSTSWGSPPPNPPALDFDGTATATVTQW